MWVQITCWVLVWRLMVWKCDYFKSLMWNVKSFRQLFPFPIWPEFNVTGCSCRRGLKPPAIFFKVKSWRGNWASMLAPGMERRGCSVFFPGFLEGAQVSGRWQQDETQRQPGESLEGEPGSSSSQVLSWSALDKRETASSICSSSLCLITTRCPYTHCHCHWREFKIVGEEMTNFAGKNVLNCVKSGKRSQLALCQLILVSPYGKSENRTGDLLDVSIQK